MKTYDVHKIAAKLQQRIQANDWERGSHTRVLTTRSGRINSDTLQSVARIVKRRRV